MHIHDNTHFVTLTARAHVAHARYMKEVHVVLPVYRLNTESDAYAKYTQALCRWTDVASMFSIATCYICTGCVVPDFPYLQDARIECHRVVGLIVRISNYVVIYT